MSNQDLLSNLLKEIEAPLLIQIPENEHYLPTKKEQLDEAITICDSLKKKHSKDNSVIEFIEQEEAWLKEGLELLEDENSIPFILIDKLDENASLPYKDTFLPADTQELEIWKYIVSFFKDLSPSDKDTIEAFNTYSEFVEHYDGNEAFEYSLQEISENIYSQKGENGSCNPANKEEVLKAISISIREEDFDDFSPETLEQIKNQQEGFDYLMDAFDITNEDIESYKEKIYADNLPISGDEPNALAYDYVNQMYENLSYVDKESNRWAASANEVNDGYSFLNKAEAAIQDSDDDEIHQLINTNKEHLDEASVRRFAGAWWLIVCAGIVAIIQLVTAFKSFDNTITPDNAVTYIANEKNRLENNITRLETKEELTKDDQKYLKEYKEELSDLGKLTPEKYSRQYNRRKKRNAWGNVLTALISFAWIIAYYFAARPYGYDRFKRQRQYAIIRKATGFTAKILSAILGAFWAMPITTYITKYTDGSEERSNDAIGVLAIQLIVTGLIIAMVLYLARIIIPFAAVIAYIRNYPEKIGAKQIHKVMGDSKGFAEKYIDKIKNKNKAA